MSARYRVGHDYRARYGSEPLAFTAGDEVEVDDAVAKWVNDDSPETLLPLDAAEPEPEPDGNPEGEPEGEPEPEPQPEQKTEQPARRGRRGGAK